MQTIIFLHGALGAASQFEAVTSFLKADYNCICLDFPQHGNNADDATHAIESYANYVIDKIESDHLEKVYLFGYSMGGYIALLVAHQRPDLILKVLTLATKFDWNKEVGSKQLAMLDADKMQDKIPQYTKYLQSLHPLAGWQQVVQHTYAIIQHLITDPPLQGQQLSEIEIPCRIGLGDKDNMVSLSETVESCKQLKQGSLYVLPETIHPLEKVNPALIAQQCINYFTVSAI